MATRRKINPAPARTPVELFSGNLCELIETLKRTNQKDLAHYLRRDWVGDYFTSLDEACKKIEIGDPELLKQYTKQEKRIKAYNAQTTYTTDVQGSYIDFALYNTGVPECWIRQEQEPTPAKFSDIYINVGLNNTVTQSEVFRKLINIVQLIDTLEADGHRLNVFLIATGQSMVGNPANATNFFKVQVKKESEPVNLQQLVYLIATPVLLRFAVLFLRSAIYGCENGGKFLGDMQKEKELVADEKIIYIPSFHYDQDKYISSYEDLAAIYPHLEKSF